MKPDARCFRIVLVTDRLRELRGRRASTRWPSLGEAGWGVMQLPADDYPPRSPAPLLAEVAEQAEEF